MDDEKLKTRIRELEKILQERQQSAAGVMQQIEQLQQILQTGQIDIAGITASLVELKTLLGVDPEKPLPPETAPRPADPRSVPIICPKCSAIFGSDPKNELSLQPGDICPSCRTDEPGALQKYPENLPLPNRWPDPKESLKEEEPEDVKKVKDLEAEITGEHDEIQPVELEKKED